MVQTKFKFPEVNDEEIKKAVSFLNDLFLKARQRFKDYSLYERVILYSGHYESNDVVDEQKPEELVKQYVAKPLLEFLGYDVVNETIVNSPFGRRSPDYLTESSRLNKRYFLVEVEPMNVDLNSRGRGLGQVREWLLSIRAGTQYGVATDGLTWILAKYDLSSDGLREVLKVDLRALVSSFLGSSLLDDESIRGEIEKLLSLKLRNFESLVNNYLIEVEQQKEEITQRFYAEYVENVFGLDTEGKVTGGVSLLSSIIAPSDMKNPKSQLFALITMNRLLFIAFLQDRGIVAPNFIENLHTNYESSQPMDSLYSSYIKPLFYEVLNKEKSMRSATVRRNDAYRDIPYLNGGLFRQNIENEDRYDIRNEGLELVLDKLIGRYKIGLGAESELKPEVLGYIFEKTINYISGQGTQKQKAEGAYYTPDDVVSFIVEKTLMKEIYESLLKGLKSAGWQERDFSGYDSVESILENAPRNPKHIQSMVSSLYTMKVLDPACGSGHFLVAATNAITRVIASLYMEIDKTFSQYEIRREVISRNIFGVDIDEIGVEITKLRLWLSVISDIGDGEEIDPSSIKTLPNIDFNIIAGNSLVGQLFEPFTLSIEDSEGALDEEQLKGISGLTEHDRAGMGKLFRSNKTDDISSGYQMLLGIYRMESGQDAMTMHNELLGVRNMVYGSLDRAFMSYVMQNGQKKKKKVFPESGWLNRPFHWAFDFAPILITGGFDVVMGNPPYIEDGNYTESDLAVIRFEPRSRKNSVSSRIPSIYESRDCGNTYAYFMERSINLLKDGGKFGFIVPISLVSTDRMGPIREIVHKKSGTAEYFNFDDRPGKIFSGTEHSRSTIIITTKGAGTMKIRTSRYHRWRTADRPYLFNKLQTVDYGLREQDEIIPKIGSEIERSIIDKLAAKSRGSTIGSFIGKGKQTVWYHNAPQYWIHTHTENHVPLAEYYEYREQDGKILLGKMLRKEVTSQYKCLEFKKGDAVFVSALMNSSLFYWWFVINSDGRHLLTQHISSFPVNLNFVDKKYKGKLSGLLKNLMESYDNNSNIKVNARKGGYAIKIKEIIPKLSYDIIQKIDVIMVEIFGLDDDEANFIETFDRSFRMGKEGKDTEESTTTIG